MLANKLHSRSDEFFAVGGGGDHFRVLSHVHVPAADRDGGAQGRFLELEIVELFIYSKIVERGRLDHSLIVDVGEPKVQVSIEIGGQILGREGRVVITLRDRLFCNIFFSMVDEEGA